LKLARKILRKKIEWPLEHFIDFMFCICVAFLVAGMLIGGFLFWDCPRVALIGDHCCIDTNLNSICDSQEGVTNVVVQARGEGDVVVVTGLNVVERGSGSETVLSTAPTTTTTAPRTSTTSTTSTTASITTSTTVDTNQTADQTGDGEIIEDCDHIDLYVIRVVYNDGEDSNVEVLMRNDGLFDLKKFRIKVYDEENGLALQQSFYKRVNASHLDEYSFEFGDNDIVHSGNDVVRVKIAPIIGEDICEEISIYGDQLITHNG
jgi:hypothetical protein